jgi:Trk-type K+ transport system membrane component
MARSPTTQPAPECPAMRLSVRIGRVMWIGRLEVIPVVMLFMAQVRKPD